MYILSEQNNRVVTRVPYILRHPIYIYFPDQNGLVIKNNQAIFLSLTLSLSLSLSLSIYLSLDLQKWGLTIRWSLVLYMRLSLFLKYLIPLLSQANKVQNKLNDIKMSCWRCPWCNGYRRRKWTRRREFKSWTRLIAFTTALIPLGKVWIQLFSLQ